MEAFFHREEVRGMPAKLYRVNLTQEERAHLLGITRRGQSSGRKVKRSLILCKADEGLTDREVAEALMVGPATVSRVRQRFVGSVSWKEGWSAPSTICRGRDNGANLMASRKPTWWPWPAAHPRKGTPAGHCNCWRTKRCSWS